MKCFFFTLSFVSLSSSFVSLSFLFFIFKILFFCVGKVSDFPSPKIKMEGEWKRLGRQWTIAWMKRILEYTFCALAFILRYFISHVNCSQSTGTKAASIMLEFLFFYWTRLWAGRKELLVRLLSLIYVEYLWTFFYDYFIITIRKVADTVFDYVIIILILTRLQVNFRFICAPVWRLFLSQIFLFF